MAGARRTVTEKARTKPRPRVARRGNPSPFDRSPLLDHRFDAAAFAAGGKACKPRILGIGADQRRPSTRMATGGKNSSGHRP
jgi:hypothetical protein